MTAVFTKSAVANLRSMAATTADKDELSKMMTKLDALPVGKNLGDAGANLLARGGDADVFLVPSGSLQVILTTSPQAPNTVVVSGVYRSTDGIDAIIQKAVRDSKEAAGSETAPHPTMSPLTESHIDRFR